MTSTVYHLASGEPAASIMTGQRLGECQIVLGWGNRLLAEMLEMDERQVRRWRAGAPIPTSVARWLETLVAFHLANPPPARPAATAPS